MRKRVKRRELARTYRLQMRAFTKQKTKDDQIFWSGNEGIRKKRGSPPQATRRSEHKLLLSASNSFSTFVSVFFSSSSTVKVKATERRNSADEAKDNAARGIARKTA